MCVYVAVGIYSSTRRTLCVSDQDRIVQRYAHVQFSCNNDIVLPRVSARMRFFTCAHAFECSGLTRIVY